MRSRFLPLSKTANILPLKGLFVITEDKLSVASYLSKLLLNLDAEVEVIPTKSLLNREELSKQIKQFQQPVKGIIHLAGLEKPPTPETLNDWRYYSQIHSKSLFHLLQLCADDLNKTPSASVVTVSLLGGQFGRNGKAKPGLATAGGTQGLIKTMDIEWANVRALCLDFDDSLSEEIAQHIINELQHPGKHIEVGYMQGKRLITEAIVSPIEDAKTPIKPQSDWVILITGGARGITSEVAREFLIPGVRLILVGRSPEPGDESPETIGIDNISQLRNVLIVQNKGKSIAPVQIENQIKGILRDRSIRRNLQDYRQAGVKVEYHSLDVRNEAEFGTFIQDIYQRYGRLDAVIHGAGIIEDKLLTDITTDSFNRVFDTKVDSAFLLSRHLQPDSLKLLILFTSVAGTFGNRGQSAYTAANEVVNRLAWQLDEQWKNTRIIAINWGPWDITGMASDEVNRQFKERGIIPIPPLSGRRFVRDELQLGKKGDTELIVGTFGDLIKPTADEASSKMNY